MELRDVVPFLVPVLVGVATALVSRAILTASGLRKELAADVQLLAALPRRGRAYGHLNSSVQVRALRLVALVRYPTFATTDLVGVLGVLGCAAVSVTYAFRIVTGVEPADWFTTVAFPVVMAGIAWSSWRVFFDGWSRRAASRFTFVKKHLDAVDVEELAVLFRGVDQVVLLVSVVVVFGPHLAFLMLSLEHVFGVPSGYSISGVVVLFVLGGFALGREVIRSPLARALPLPPRDQRLVDRYVAVLAAQGASGRETPKRHVRAVRPRGWPRGKSGSTG